MSTQESKDQGIPFLLTEPLENIRLLEVPDDLLDIIENTQQEIYLKSAPVLVGNGISSLSGGSKGDVSDDSRQGNVHLCTSDKVWGVKQVSTSNSIYVTRTCEVKGESNDHTRDENRLDRTGQQDEDVDMEIEDSNSNKLNEQAQSAANNSNKDGSRDKGPSTGISAYAKPTSVLELLALPPKTYETVVLEHLRALPHYSLSELHEHIPAPTKIIQRVLAQKCVFEVRRQERSRNASPSTSNSRSAKASKSNGSKSDENATITTRTYVPSSTLLLSTWNEIVQVATLTDTPITGPENAEILSHDTADQSLRGTNGKETDMMNLDIDVDGQPQQQRQQQTFDIPSDANTDEINKIIQQIIAKRMFEKDGYFATIGVMTPSSSSGPNSNNDSNGMKLNSRECTRWVGNLILAATMEDEDGDEDEDQRTRQLDSPNFDLPDYNQTTSTKQTGPAKGLSKSTFESKWENSVPASWIKFCSVEVLRGSCEVYTLSDINTPSSRGVGRSDRNDDRSQVMVRWAPYTLESETDLTSALAGIPGTQGASSNGSKAGGAGGSAGSTKNKRKWHEKFAAQRNVKK